MKQRSGKSKTLTLSAGEIARFFGKLCIKPSLVFQKCGKVNSVQNIKLYLSMYNKY